LKQSLLQQAIVLGYIKIGQLKHQLNPLKTNN